MAYVAKPLINTKAAEVAATTQFTATTYTVIEAFTAHNGTGGVASIAVYVVPSGSAVGAENRLVSRALADGESYTMPELVGHTLRAGDSIATSATAGIVIRASGLEITG